jgi:hypothetical protein
MQEGGATGSLDREGGAEVQAGLDWAPRFRPKAETHTGWPARKLSWVCVSLAMRTHTPARTHDQPLAADPGQAGKEARKAEGIDLPAAHAHTRTRVGALTASNSRLVRAPFFARAHH